MAMIISNKVVKASSPQEFKNMIAVINGENRSARVKKAKAVIKKRVKYTVNDRKQA